MTGAAPGTLHLRAIEPAGWTGTSGDNGGAVTVTAAGGQSVTAIDLGQRRLAPAIESLMPSSSTVSSGSMLTLHAVNVDPATGKLRFYRESNGITGLQTGAGEDTVLEVDYEPADDWGIALRAGLSTGTYVFYATAEDEYGFVGAPATGTVVVTGSPGQTEVSITNVNNAVKENGTLPGVFEVRRTGANGADLIVTVAALAGAGLATSGSDFYALPPTVTIPAGQDAVRLRVYPIAEGASEPTEIARLAVLPGTGYTVGAGGSADVQIRDTASPNVVAVTSSKYDFETFPPGVRLTLSDDVASSLSLVGIGLQNLSTGLIVPTNQLGLAYDPSSGVARAYIAPSMPNRLLADGNYRITVR